jgi:cytochrome b subunit of formate dehydrogenase
MLKYKRKLIIQGGKMDKPKINYIVDFFMTISFIITAISGLVIFFFLPEGIKRGGYQQFMGIMKQNWILIHDYSGIIMLVLVIVHFLLHWNWIVCMTKSFFQKKQKKCD